MLYRRRCYLAEEIDADVLIDFIRSQLMFEGPTSEKQLSILTDDVARDKRFPRSTGSSQLPFQAPRTRRQHATPTMRISRSVDRKPVLRMGNDLCPAILTESRPTRNLLNAKTPLPRRISDLRPTSPEEDQRANTVIKFCFSKTGSRVSPCGGSTSAAHAESSFAGLFTNVLTG